MKRCLPPSEDLDQLRETAVKIKRQEFPLVSAQTQEGEWVEAQKLREDGDRITVRWNDSRAKYGSVVRTVFRETFDKWQTGAFKDRE